MPSRGGPGPEIRLRAYRRSDHPKVVRLWRAAGLSISPSDRRDEIERARRRVPELFVVAESRGRLVGAVFGRFDGRRGWINHLAVAGRFRRRGVGRRLMLEVEARLAALGCPKVNLHVLTPNRSVVGFYASLGYSVADMLLLQKWLHGHPRPTSRRRA